MKQKASRYSLYVIRLLTAFFMIGNYASSAQLPVASFTVSSSQGCQPLNVQFTNTSSNASSYQWNFGNGNTSTQTNPNNVFTNQGTFTVTLTANGPGGSSVSSQTISVQAPPVAAFSATPLVACQGYGLIHFTNSSTGYDSIVWDFGDGIFSSLNNPDHVYAIAGTFNVSLIAIRKTNGCNNVKTINSYITILPQPSVLVTVNSAESCDPAFGFQFTSHATNGNSYFWDFGDNKTSAQQNPSHTYSDTGYFNVKLIVTSNQGCSDTAVYNRFTHIKYDPVPPISVYIDSGCAPLYTSLATIQKSGALYSWDFGDTTTGSSFIAYHHFYNPGIYIINLKIDYGNGCTNSNSFNSIKIFPSPHVLYSMSNSTGCTPLNVSFTNNTSGNFNWLWDFGDGTTSTLYSPSHIYTSMGNFQVSLTASNLQGCEDGYPLAARVITYDPEATFTPDVTSGCPPLTVNFNNTSQGTTSWLWNFGDNTTSTQQYPSHIYNNAGSYYVKLIVRNSTGCSDTLTYPVAINVNQPSVNFVPPPAVHACAPHTVNFADASAAVAWLWDFGDGTTSTLANPSHTYSSQGTFTVGLTTWMPNGGCEYHISNFQTFIIDAAIPDYSYTVSHCPPYIVTFHDSSINASSWSWTFGDGGSSNLQNPSHEYANPGSYNITLEVTTPGGCTTTLQDIGGVHFTGLGAFASMLVNDTIAPIDVQFNSNSTYATWWHWDFGDSATSSLSDPFHTFSGFGPYNISLTIGNDSCHFTYHYPPVKFGPSGSGSGSLGGIDTIEIPVVYHCAPYAVQFTNPLPNSLSVKWFFGDGFTSALFSPLHTYSTSGDFLAYLVAIDSSGITDTIFYSDSLHIVKPVSDFNISTQNTCSGVIVNVNTTDSTLTSIWNFGNNITSNLPAASVLYPNSNASYVISLNAVDTNHCSSYVAKSFAVNVNNPLSASKRNACSGDSINFNVGNMNYASYLWTFSDGTTSSVRNPAHAFADSGYYQVSLAATDINNCTTSFNLIYLIQIFDPEPSFTFTPPLSNCTVTQINFTNTSTNSDSWLWNFGDGSTSTICNPQHNYFVLGYHDVTLTAYQNVCSKSITIPNLVYNANLKAGFTYTYDKNCLPATAAFTDTSTDAVQWLWDFSDGSTSTVKNPVHVFSNPPKGNISLTVTDVNGCSKTVVKPAFIATKSDFVVSDTSGCNPLTVTFSDSSSNVISWYWNFGDNTFSSLQNPSHVYSTDGFYNVQLIVQSSTGCYDTLNVDSLIAVGTATADFTADSTLGCVPLVTNFTDLSQTTTSWNWDFGDGGTSNIQNPSHIYTVPGIYTVTLTGQNVFGCSDTVIKSKFITVKGSIPYFTVSTTNGCSPVTIAFTDSSQGAIGWNWHFGDGTIDSVENPFHIYSDSGSYTVSLYTIDSSGCSTIFTLPQQINISPVIPAYFTTNDLGGCTPYTVHLDNTGTVADTLIWIMGDGTIIYGNNPSYTYMQGGTYYISLVTQNGFGCTDTFTFNQPVVVNNQPNAGFLSDINQGCAPVAIQFINTSELLYDPQFHWDFGNGDTSDLENPSIIFNADGVFSVTLTVMNEGGCTSVYQVTDAITVFDTVPPPATSIYRVTVNDDHEVELNWQLCNLHDMNYYVVYKYNPFTSVYDSISQIFQNNVAIVNNTPVFKDFNVNTLSSSYSYKVQAVDFCLAREPESALRAHETMNVEGSAGLMKVDLIWSPYLGCDFTKYEIYRQDNLSGPFQFIASVDTSLHQFTDTTTFCPIIYSYKIKAIAICNESNFNSWSDSAQAQPSSDLKNQSVEVVRSTVVDNRYVLTEWKTPVLYPYLIDRYNIYRSTDKQHYDFIASVPHLVHEFSDYEANVQQQEYYYKVEIQNICNIATLPGEVNSSILLKSYQSDVKNTLKWTKYFDWTTGVDRYVIEKLNSNNVWEEVDTVNSSTFEWEEK